MQIMIFPEGIRRWRRPSHPKSHAQGLFQEINIGEIAVYQDFVRRFLESRSGIGPLAVDLYRKVCCTGWIDLEMRDYATLLTRPFGCVWIILQKRLAQLIGEWRNRKRCRDGRLLSMRI